MPITFVLVDQTLYSAIDHKPKSTTNLKRLRNIERDPRVTLLAHEYADDWDALWWCRAEGNARIEHAMPAELIDRYPAYSSHPPDGPCVAVTIERISGWQAGS